MNESESVQPKRRPWVWVLSFIVVSVVGFGTLIGIGCAIGANSCLLGEKRQETSTDGAMIFARNCALCHGIDADGTSDGPSLLSEGVAALSFDDLTYKIGRGRPFAGMPAFKREFSEAQITAVAEYLVQRQRGDQPAPEQEVSP